MMNRSLFVFTLFALSSLLVSCSSTTNMKVLVSDNRDDYSIYSDGELACSSSYDCIVPVSTDQDQVQLEARKSGTIYGRLQVNRGEDLYKFNPWLLKHWPFLSGGSGRSNYAFLLIDVFILPVALVEAVVPKKEAGKFPTEVVIPVDGTKKWISPWD